MIGEDAQGDIRVAPRRSSMRGFLGLADFAWHFLPWSGLVGGQGFSNGDFA
jgi:hypothetical protein